LANKNRRCAKSDGRGFVRAGPFASGCEERRKQRRERGCEDKANSKGIACAPAAWAPTEHYGDAGEACQANGYLCDQGKSFDSSLLNAA